MKSKVLAVFAFTLLVGLACAAGNAPQPTICNRACWGATSATCSTNISSLNRAVVHHTAGSGDYNVSTLDQSKAKIRGIQSYQKSLGWCDIGYHFLVDKLGNAFEGRVRSINQLVRGAHDAVNTNSFGFCMTGYYHSPYNQSPTTAGRNRLYDVVAWRIPNPFTGYGSGTYNGKTVGYIAGHRNVNPTACPGDLLYTYIGTNYSGGTMRDAVNQRIVGSTGFTITVDNTSAGFSASANWWTGSFGSPYGSNYHVRGTAAVSDPAQWNYSCPSTGSTTVLAWWTDGANRASSAAYILTRNGGTSTVAVNQQVNGGKWNTLGSFTINAGANDVKLSCWTTSGDVVIADAVRIQR